MRRLIILGFMLMSSLTYANQTVVCSAKILSRNPITVAIKLDFDNLFQLTKLTFLKGNQAPFLSEKDESLGGSLPLVYSNLSTKVFDVTGDLGDQSYYNARLIVPISNSLSKVKYEFSSMTDDGAASRYSYELTCNKVPKL